MQLDVATNLRVLCGLPTPSIGSAMQDTMHKFGEEHKPDWVDPVRNRVEEGGGGGAGAVCPLFILLVIPWFFPLTPPSFRPPQSLLADALAALDAGRFATFAAIRVFVVSAIDLAVSRQPWASGWTPPRA